MFNFNNEIIIPFEKCTNIQGFSDLTSDIVKEKLSNGEGSIILGSSVNAREMLIEFDVNIDLADEMQRYFKPKINYTLYIADRKISCVVVSSSLIQDPCLALNPTLSLSLFAADPYFYDISDFGQNIAGIMPMFGFPWTATIVDGITFGYRIFTDKTIFRNNGDKPVGFRLKITAKGLVESFKFENLRTGKYIQVNTILADGDVLEISSVAGIGNKYIKKNGENIYKDIERLSGYFYLDVGDNFLRFSADSGSTNMEIYLFYSPAYANGGIR